MDRALPALLDGLEHIFAEQARALHGGDADALPALTRQLQQRLGELVRVSTRRPLPASLRPRVMALLQRLRASDVALGRRQRQVEGALGALGMAIPTLQELQARSVYGAGGALATPAWRSRGFERA